MSSGRPSKPIAVIPSRYGSTRFPGKPLALIAGKPMVQHVYERCVDSGAFQAVLVATEDERIVAAVEAFGGQARMTSMACTSGTDRAAEVARAMEGDVFVNVQGDEPAVHPEALRTLVGAFSDRRVEMATLIRSLEDDERANPNVVKAVVGVDGNALYFSRADIPFQRGPTPAERHAHLGLYGYRRETLLKLASLPPSPLEQVESLEQLRALENGIRIACRVTSHVSLGVDTPADLAKAEALLKSR